MADAAALKAAITALKNVIAPIQTPAPSAPVFDPFVEDQPFNLANCAGNQAYTNISAALNDKDMWNGNISSFPSFIVALRLRVEEGKRNTTAPHGILTINGNNILSDYHSIKDALIEVARMTWTDNRAIQNSCAMFQCIKSSIRGSIWDTIFTQSGNIPMHADGNTLFKKLTTFTTVASLQLLLLSFNSILEFNHFDHAFNVPTINTKLMNLFTLAATQHRTLDSSERIQHTLNVYSKILQPEVWAQWARAKIDSFEEGTITVCQYFMNSATMKYNKLLPRKVGSRDRFTRSKVTS